MSEAATETTATEGTSEVAATEDTLLGAAVEQQTPDTGEVAETEKVEGDEGKETEGKETKGAPEQYEDFSAPEGVELDVELTGELKTLAKELNLSQADAQRVADLGAKLAEKFAGQQTEALAQARTEWTEQSRADKEFGGDKIDANLAVAKKALDTFGSPELKQLLNESGLGSHPEIIRAFYRAGKAISEDSLVTGETRKGATPKTPEAVLYPDHPQQ